MTSINGAASGLKRFVIKDYNGVVLDILDGSLSQEIAESRLRFGEDFRSHLYVGPSGSTNLRLVKIYGGWQV